VMKKLSFLILFLLAPCLAETVRIRQEGFEFTYDTGTLLQSRAFKAHAYLTKDLPGPELYQTPAFLYQEGLLEEQRLQSDATIDIVELDGCPVIIKLSPSDHCQMLVLAVYPPGSINGKFERILFLEYNFETINAEDYDSVLGLLKESFRWTLEEPDPAQNCQK